MPAHSKAWSPCSSWSWSSSPAPRVSVSKLMKRSPKRANFMTTARLSAMKQLVKSLDPQTQLAKFPPKKRFLPGRVLLRLLAMKQLHLLHLFVATWEIIGSRAKKKRVKTCQNSSPKDRFHCLKELFFSWVFRSYTHFMKIFKASGAKTCHLWPLLGDPFFHRATGLFAVTIICRTRGWANPAFWLCTSFKRGLVN